MLRAACRTAVVAAAIITSACVGTTVADAAVTCTRSASPAGSDAAAGTVAAPFRTVQKLVDSLRAGQTGCLRSGRYEQDALLFAAAGTSSARITLTSYPGERATISAQKVYVPAGADFVTISSLDIDGRPYDSPTLQVMARDTVIEDDTITNHNLAQSCLVLGSVNGYGQAVRPIVRRSRLPDCGDPANGMHDHAIYVENAIDARITENVIYNAAAWGVHLYPQAQRTVISSNVIDSSGGGIIIAGSETGSSSGTTVANNAITNSTKEFGVQSYWGGGAAIGTGNVVRNNCLFRNFKGNVDPTGLGFTTSGNVVADPLYYNAAARDYRLRTTSPCARIAGTLMVGNRPPGLVLTSPVGGTALGASVCPQVTATDDARVVRVRFYLDSALVLDDDTPAFGNCLTTAGLATGKHVLLARAYDADGGTAESSVTVSKGVAATTTAGGRPPTVTLTMPVGDSVFGGYVCPFASASDDAGVVRVRFYLDATLLLDDTTPEYGNCFSTTAVALGAHTLTARAFDANGGTASSAVAVIRK